MNATTANLVLQSRSAPIAVLAALVLLTTVAYRDTLAGLIALWLSSDTVDYSHGSLLLGLSLLLAGRTLWREPDAFGIRPNLPGAAALVTTALVWGVSSLLLIEVGARLAFWLLFPSLVLAVSGWHSVRRLWLPLVLLVFGIPVWSVFNEPLRLGTAHVVTWLLGFGGITALLEGSTITLTVGKFYIADNCTGMRQLVVAMPLALLFAGWTGLRVGPGILLFACAVGMSFLLNVIRILIVVVAGAMTDMQHYFVKEDHVSLGWVLFGVGMLVFFLAASHLMPRRWLATVEDTATKNRTPPARASTGLVVGMAMAAALLVPVGVSALMAAPVVAADRVLELPAQLGEWASFESREARKSGGRFTGADDEVTGTYINSGDRPVLVQIALYYSQRPGHEAVAWVNSPFDSGSWRFLSDEYRQIEVGDAVIPVREILVASPSGQRRVIWTWYRVAGSNAAGATNAKLVGLRGLICGRTDAASIVVTTVGPAEAADSRKTLQAFLAGAEPTLMRQLEHAIGNAAAQSWC